MIKRALVSVVVLLSLIATPPIAVAQTAASAGGNITFIGTGASSALVVFGVTPVPAGTCTMYGNYQFIFDASTPGGKNMYALLLELRALGHTVGFDYLYSTTPGTTQTNGCTQSTLSAVNSIYAGF